MFQVEVFIPLEIGQAKKSMKITGKHIAAARALLGISQAELAEATGGVVSAHTILRFEAGGHDPRPATVDALTRFFEARGIEFLNGDGLGVRFRPKLSGKEASVD